MRFEDWTELHEDKKANYLLAVLVEETKMITSEKVAANTARFVWRNEEEAAYHDREARAHEDRAQWLLEQITFALVSAEDGIG